MIEPLTSIVPLVTDTSCFLCARDTVRCGTAAVVGRLRGASITQVAGRVQPRIGLVAPDGTEILLKLRPEHERLVLRLVPITFASNITLRALHLGPPQRVHPPSGKDYIVYQGLPATLCIVEPDLLINITDLSNGNYCVRQELLRHLYPSGPTPASVRGNLIHSVFKEMLKGAARPEAVPDTLDLLERGIQTEIVSIAQAGATESEVRAEIEPHIGSLGEWLSRQQSQLWSSTPNVRAETFLLAPEIGLKGRLDILWTDDKGSHLLELKTGRATGDLPKQDHRWQVYGYHALLAVRNNHASDHRVLPQAKLLYSGTPGAAQSYGIPSALREIQRVIEMRNDLALVRLSGKVPSPPGGNRCAKCALRLSCAEMSPVLGWEAPDVEAISGIAKVDADWFRYWYSLQMLEARAADKATHALWQLSAAERIAAGSAIGGLVEISAEQNAKNEWNYRYRCDNTSELREGDEVLLSVDDPIRGEVVSGSILQISSTEALVWARESISGANQIDRYSADVTTNRMVANLSRWLHIDEHRRALVRGVAKPRFDIDPLLINPEWLKGLNAEQANAVVRALTMKDYLLIQGPPGTGKTQVIAAITKALLARGFRVGLGAFTNQATDNMLRKLVESGYTKVLRLGHELAVAPDMRPYRLVASTGTPHPTADDVRSVLQHTPVVAATVTSWSSNERDTDRMKPDFDVMIIDEATQLTVPAVLGALRWGKRFILVGDQSQLPPLVQSESREHSDAALVSGLGTSLFETLLASASDDSSIRLYKQYRMHEAICAFPSRKFYGNALLADDSVAKKTLADVIPSLQTSEVMPSYQQAILDPARPLVWVEVRPGIVTSSPKLNVAEAHVAASLARSLIASGVSASDIGIIAPFRAQAARIRQTISDLVECGTTIDTVDRFQGGERSVIILSLTAATPPLAKSPLAVFLSDARRLNVALTRARHKLIILGHAAALEGLPLLRDLADHCAAQPGGVVQWED